MNYQRIEKIQDKFNRQVERAERMGDDKGLMLLDMELEDSMILKLDRVSGIVDEDELF